MNKQCTKCHEIKNISFFNATKNGKFGVRGDCKECTNIERRKYLKTDREKRRQIEREKYLSMSAEKKKKYIEKRKQWNFSKKGKELRKKHRNSDRGKYTSYKHDCKRRKKSIEFKLTFEEFKILINSNCYYCNKTNCRGIDRIDSNLGYTPENSVPCCFPCNKLKGTFSKQEFFDRIKIIFENHFNN